MRSRALTHRVKDTRQITFYEAMLRAGERLVQETDSGRVLGSADGNVPGAKGTTGGSGVKRQKQINKRGRLKRQKRMEFGSTAGD
jgi:hypothetical protein